MGDAGQYKDRSKEEAGSGHETLKSRAAVALQGTADACVNGTSGSPKLAESRADFLLAAAEQVAITQGSFMHV